MEIKGQVIQLLDLQSGTGKEDKEWKKQEYILETLDAKYPKKVCVAVWGEKIDQFNIQVGETITASIEVESREFNDRWYTNIQAWKIERENSVSKESLHTEDNPLGEANNPNF